MRQIDNKDIRAKYNCSKWNKVRKLKILEVNGLCERCRKQGIMREGVIVHHKNYINEQNYMDDNVMYNLDNLELLCETCHQAEHFNTDDFYFDSEGNVCSGKERFGD